MFNAREIYDADGAKTRTAMATYNRLEEWAREHELSNDAGGRADGEMVLAALEHIQPILRKALIKEEPQSDKQLKPAPVLRKVSDEEKQLLRDALEKKWVERQHRDETETTMELTTCLVCRDTRKLPASGTMPLHECFRVGCLCPGPHIPRLDPAEAAFQSTMQAKVGGRKDDKDKDRWDLLPLGPVLEVVKVLTFGAKKYAPNNWQKVENGRERYYAAMMRHLAAWRTGERTDAESGLMHLSHAACCLTFLLWLELEQHTTSPKGAGSP